MGTLKQMTILVVKFHHKSALDSKSLSNSILCYGHLGLCMDAIYIIISDSLLGITISNHSYYVSNHLP